ncbi:MAG TPA: hypothetical protein VGL65_08055 [Gemmatimonadales bacterium]
MLEIILAIVAAGSPQQPSSADTGAVVSRYPEGSTHGFLALHSLDGVELARGDLVQRANGTAIESTLSFRFGDGSRFEETVDFTQTRAIELEKYHLNERGPAFDRDLDATLWRSGRYQVRATSHRDGKTGTYAGSLHLPADVANGLPLVIAKNLRPGERRTVHLVAFLPKPRVIELEFIPAAPGRVRSGLVDESTIQFTLKPEIGGVVGLLAKLLGKIPPDSHIWIATTGAPAFLRFEGPMYTGPVWRIDLALPAWPR